MSGDGERNHNMAQRDIALLLAEASDGVEIGIAPTSALIRGGRRRKLRRWAVVATTTLVAVGSTGALALTGLSGSGDEGMVSPAGRPVVSAQSEPPMRTTLAVGNDRGTPWRVYIDVWKAPADTKEAKATLAAMAKYGERPDDVSKPADLVGRTAHFVHRVTGEEAKATQIVDLPVPKDDVLVGGEHGTVSLPLLPDSDEAARLLVGNVARTAKEVTCHWKDGTSYKVGRASEEPAVNTGAPALYSPKDSPYSWFVCLAPANTEPEKITVAK